MKCSVGTLIECSQHCLKYARMRAFWDPYFPVYGQNLQVIQNIRVIRIQCGYDQRKHTFRRNAIQRFSCQTFGQNQSLSKNSAGYKEVSAIKEVKYMEVLPLINLHYTNFPLIRLMCVMLHLKCVTISCTGHKNCLHVPNNRM